MKKYEKRILAVIICLLLTFGATLAVSAVGRAGMMPRTDSDMGDGGVVGEVTGMVEDAADALTDDGGMMEDGTNIPEDSDGIITEPETTRAPETTRERETTREATTTAADTTEVASSEDTGRGGFVGVIVAVIIAVAVILLVIALMPKKKMD